LDAYDDEDENDDPWDLDFNKNKKDAKKEPAKVEAKKDNPFE